MTDTGNIRRLFTVHSFPQKTLSIFEKADWPDGVGLFVSANIDKVRLGQLGNFVPQTTLR